MYFIRGRSEPKFNHVLKPHLDRILKQIKALPTPITNETLSTFLDQAKEDYYESRLPVRPFQPDLTIHITESLVLQYAEAVSLWMEKQDEKRKALLEDKRKQRFEACVRLDHCGERSVLIFPTHSSILDRLRDAGWGKELDFMGAKGIETMSDMPVVRKSTKLTTGGKYASYLNSYEHTDQRSLSQRG